MSGATLCPRAWTRGGAPTPPSRPLDVECGAIADRCTIAEAVDMLAPNTEALLDVAWQEFGPRALDASLHPGPVRLDVEVSPVPADSEPLP
jgi:hypothetical protein